MFSNLQVQASSTISTKCTCHILLWFTRSYISGHAKHFSEKFLLFTNFNVKLESTRWSCSRFELFVKKKYTSKANANFSVLRHILNKHRFGIRYIIPLEETTTKPFSCKNFVKVLKNPPLSYLVVSFSGLFGRWSFQFQNFVCFESLLKILIFCWNCLKNVSEFQESLKLNKIPLKLFKAGVTDVKLKSKNLFVLKIFKKY